MKRTFVKIGKLIISLKVYRDLQNTKLYLKIKDLK